MLKKGHKLSSILTGVVLLLGILSGVGYSNFLKAIISVFSPASIDMILTIIMVCVLGGLMKHYGILDEIVCILEDMTNDTRSIIMLIPAMIGLLIVPGGAMLSAPFVNEMGKETHIPAAKRAAINLVFRHIAMFIMPYSTSLLLIRAMMPNISIIRVIMLNSIFVAFIVIIGYIFFIKDVKVKNKAKRKFTLEKLTRFLKYTSPIYACVVINIITGLPFYITIFFSVLIVYLLSDKLEFLKTFIKSIHWDTVIIVVAIIVIKEMIQYMDPLLLLFSEMFSKSGNMYSIMFVFFIASIFFGAATGHHTPPLAVIIPMLSKLDCPSHMLYVYLYFSYVSAFFGYFFSPLHLCQVFTTKIMNISALELYNEYKYYFVTLLGLLVLSTIALSKLLALF